MVFDVEALVEHFTNAGSCWGPTADEVETAGGRVGRNAYPALVAALDAEGLLRDEVASVVVPSSWCDVEFPMRALDRDTWHHLFTRAGYTVNGVPQERPDRPLTLWRGAVDAYADGWSWTDDRQVARWFAERRHQASLGGAKVWRATVEPSRLLARISDGRPGETCRSCGLHAD